MPFLLNKTESLKLNTDLFRNNSEKLAVKIREQAAAIIHLNSDKEKLTHENELLQQQLRKVTQDLENASFDKEKIKVNSSFYSQFS